VGVQVVTQVAAFLKNATTVAKTALEQHIGALCDRIPDSYSLITVCRNALERFRLEIEDMTGAIACIRYYTHFL
jgi:hypothetical protein